MGSKEFLNIAKAKVADYFNSNKDKTDSTGNMTVDDIFVVWYCKTLQNHNGYIGVMYDLTKQGISVR